MIAMMGPSIGVHERLIKEMVADTDQVSMIRRDRNRRVAFETGGALAGQMSVSDAPSITIFDAHFRIPYRCLLQTLPHFVNREGGC